MTASGRDAAGVSDWDSADVSAIRGIEPDFSDAEIVGLLDHYQQRGKRLPVAYAANGKTSGRLRRDLERVRAGTASAAAAPGGGEAPGGENAPRRMVTTRASEIEPEAVLWMWDDRVPVGHVTLLAGREGIGKSLLACWLCARVTCGELEGALKGVPRDVMYCTTEDSWAQTIVPRLQMAGADLARVHRVDMEAVNGDGGYSAAEFTLPQDAAILAAKVRQLDAALVVIDPVMSAADTSIDTHSDQETRRMLQPLGRLAAATGTTLLGITHFNKNGQQRDPLNLVTGSRAFTAFARCVIAVAHDPATKNSVITQVKNNLGPLDVPSLAYQVSEEIITGRDGQKIRTGKLSFTGNAARGVWEILSDTDTATDRAESADCAGWLREQLEKGPMRSPELEAGAKAAGYSEATVKRARRKLKVNAVKKDDGWWAELPGVGGA